MGLDTTHNAWHGAYSAFHRWRKEIAKVAGLPPLDLMEGFYIRGHYTDPFMDFKKIYPSKEQIGATLFENVVSQFPIKWSCLKPSPLHELLCHSDCDGYINYGACGKIANELEKLLPLLPDEDAGGHIGVWKEKTQQFIDGLRLAHSKKQKLEFR